MFREFESGERWLYHKELFGISTNIIDVESGINTFKEILSKYPNFYDRSKQDNFSFYLRYNKEQGYSSQSCKLFCPYKDKCNHSKDILSTVKPRHGTMERVANYVDDCLPKEKVGEVYEDLKNKLSQFIEAEEKMWYIIKAQTAAGKTQAYLELMKTSDKRFLIAAPTNKLKQDIKRRAHEEDVELMVTPSLDEIKNEMPAEVWKHICHLRETGQHERVHTFVYRMAAEEKIKCLQEYLIQQKKYEEHGGHTVTTHRRLLNMSKKALAKYDVIIIDEDIILSSIASNQCEIPISLLKKIRKLAIKTHFKDPAYQKLIKP